MESIIASRENAQIVDIESSGYVEADCLGISLILRKVFQHCSTRDLVKFSLVNKLWNYEARSVLKDRGSLSASVTKGPAPCGEDLRAFTSNLRRMIRKKSIVPFSGLTIALRGADSNHEEFCGELSTRRMNRIYDDLLHHMQLKHLSVSCGSNWKRFYDCPGFLLVKKVLESHWRMLEELSICVSSRQWDYIERVLKNCSFPGLKILRIRDRDTNAGALYARLIKALVSRAPNLQELHTQGRLDLMENLLEGSSAVHVTDYEYFPGLREIPECAAGQLGLKRVNFLEAKQDLNREKFNRTTPMLLQASRKTLTSMKVNAMFLVPLMRYGVCLENVEALDVCFPLCGSEISNSKPSARRLMEFFDFTRIFPNLSTVHIDWATEYRPNLERIPKVFLDLFDSEIGTLVQPMPDRAENIKKLSLDFHRDIFLVQSSEFLVRMFPHVHCLQVRARDIYFGNLWNSWVNLEKLDITLRVFHGHISNWDCIFCGIFEEEVDELRKQDEEYLRRVNIVPVMPSLTCLRGLRTFSFFLEDGNRTRLEAVDDPTFLFSKVTGLIAFQRCPDLKVTLATTNKRIKKALSHMKPYATVVLRE